MNRILLIDTNTTPFNEVFPVYPVGLDYLQGILKGKGFGDTHVLDLTRMGGPLSSPDFRERARRSLALIREAVSKSHWDIIGLSLRNIDSTYPVGEGDRSLHYYLPDLLAYVDSVAEASPNSFMVLGGTAFSMMPEIFLKDRPGNCCGIIGAGESSFPGLVEALLTGGSVPRITRSDGQIIGTLQNRELIGRYLRRPVGDSTFGIRTKNGCGQRCGYCPYPLISGPRQHLKDPEKVLEEIAFMMEAHGAIGSSQPLRIMFADDIFNRPIEHAKAILRAMLDNDRLLDSWHAYLDPKHIDDELVELIFETNGWSRRLDEPGSPGHGRRWFSFPFDIENGSSRMLKKMGKPYAADHIISSVDAFKRVAARYEKRKDIAAIQFGFHVVLGYPGENEASVEETCGLINALRPDRVAFQLGVRVYPRTPLAEETRGTLWSEETDLVEPTFADLEKPSLMAWLRKYLSPHYTRFAEKGNMIWVD